MRGLRRSVAAVLLTAAVLLVPDAARAPVSVSLVKVETAKAVDFGAGVVWVLALGSDSRSSDVEAGRADAIELVAIDFRSGSAFALGIPRDSYVAFDDGLSDRINTGLTRSEGPLVMADEVEDLTGVRPQYVVTVGFAAFESLVDAVGTLQVRADIPFTDSAYDLRVRRGWNSMDGEQATGFARSRVALPRSDFDRIANQQRLMEAILRQIQRREDEVGFLEDGALAALRNLGTNLSAGELYRFAQALSAVRLGRVQTCVLSAKDRVVDGAQVLDVDPAQARRLVEDAGDDARLDGGCD